MTTLHENIPVSEIDFEADWSAIRGIRGACGDNVATVVVETTPPDGSRLLPPPLFDRLRFLAQYLPTLPRRRARIAGRVCTEVILPEGVALPPASSSEFVLGTPLAEGLERVNYASARQFLRMAGLIEWAANEAPPDELVVVALTDRQMLSDPPRRFRILGLGIGVALNGRWPRRCAAVHPMAPARLVDIVVPKGATFWTLPADVLELVEQDDTYLATTPTTTPS